MNRRTLIKAVPLGLASLVGGRLVWRRRADLAAEASIPGPSLPTPPEATEEAARLVPPEMIDPLRDEGALYGDEDESTDRLRKMADFDRTYEDDFLDV